MSARRISRSWSVALLAVAVIAVSACGSGSSPGGSTSPAVSTLAGTSWVLTGYAAAGGGTRPVSGAAPPATLAFGAAGSASGSTGCNRFTGSYAQSGSSLTIDPGATTEMACAPPLMAQERSVLEGLSSVRSFALAGKVLSLRSAAGAVVLTYLAASTDLAGTSWRATGINNGTGGMRTGADTGRVTAEFGADGTLSGNGGCNSYSATWTATGGAGLTLGPISATAMACDASATEGQYFAALGAVTSYRIEGDSLTLRDAAGAAQVTYARARG